MDLGIYEGKPFPEYCDTEAVSASEVKTLYKASCLAEFKYQKDHKEYRDSSAMLNGRAVDSLISAIANPISFPFDDYFIHVPENAVKPRANKSPKNYTSEEKLWTALEIEARRTKRELITTDVYKKALAQVESMKEGGYSEVFLKLIKEAIFQPSFFWKDSNTNLLRKSRLDAWLKTDGVIVDFKTTTEPLTKKTFYHQMFEPPYCYIIQASFYKQAVEAFGYPFTAFLFFVVRSEPPHITRVFEVDSDMLKWGEKKVDELLAVYAHALNTDEWPSFSDIELLEAPVWMKDILNKESDNGNKI